MFTGIVVSLGRIVDLQPHRLVLDAPGIHELPGESVAVDGCCLTIVSTEPAPADLQLRLDGDATASTRRLVFDILPETLSHTRLAGLAPGMLVNLEPAVRAGQPLGGHLVQGHVDAVGTVRSTVRDPEGRWLDLELDVPEDVLRLCIDRGSITVNGTSLTVMGVDSTGVRVQLIPETQHRTNLGALAPGELVNLEADVIARYVARLLPATR
ncbi:MAG: riboflavin synthase, alpha subunit [Thermoleophilia bacterium]|nr:riboflavin synthase, alpha subunit [Thermoleophilia bacterium]